MASSRSKRFKGVSNELDDEEKALIDVIPIVDDQIIQPIELIEMYAAVITDKKLTSKLIKELSEHLPLKELCHLRRVKKAPNGELLILLGPVSGISSDDTLDDLLGDKPVSRSGLGDVKVVKVASKEPMTRKQQEECSSYWTVSFHENKRLEQLLRGEYFTTEDRLRMENYARKAQEAADVAEKCGESPVGAVIIDPMRNETISVAHSLCNDHPLHHAVMVAIDLVGKSQGGGAYRFQNPYLYSRNDSLVDPENKTGPYLCTGYDLYVTREPCVMCAMALVHSRISRIFYIDTNKNGALGTRYKLHVTKGLNHHYEVFRIKGLSNDLERTS